MTREDQAAQAQGRPAPATKVKVCGLMRPEDVEAVNAAGADFAGFILTDGFRRSIDRERARELSRHLASGTVPVGVFVDEPIEYIVPFAAEGTIDAVQLHGSEDDAYIEELRIALPPGCAVVKAFKVRGEEDVARANASAADLVLLDNGQGTGETFDWSRLDGVERPFALAGGLGPDNVAQAVRRFSPYAVDMSSGVETDGRKDPGKIAAAVRAVRAAVAGDAASGDGAGGGGAAGTTASREGPAVESPTVPEGAAGR